MCEYAAPKDLCRSSTAADPVTEAYRALAKAGVLVSWFWDVHAPDSPCCHSALSTTTVATTSSSSSSSSEKGALTHSASHDAALATRLWTRKKLFVFVAGTSSGPDALVTGVTKKDVDSTAALSSLNFVGEQEYSPDNVGATHNLFAAMTAAVGRYFLHMHTLIQQIMTHIFFLSLSLSPLTNLTYRRNLRASTSFIDIGNSTFVHRPTTYLASKHGRPEDCGLAAITLSYCIQGKDIYLRAKVSRKRFWPLLLSDIPQLRPFSMPVVVGGCGAPALLQDIVAVSDVEYNAIYADWEGIVPSLQRHLLRKPLTHNALPGDAKVTGKKELGKCLGLVRIGDTSVLFPLEALLVFSHPWSSRVAYVKDKIRRFIPLTIPTNGGTKEDYWGQEPIVYHVCQNALKQKEARSGACTPRSSEVSTPGSHLYNMSQQT